MAVRNEQHLLAFLMQQVFQYTLTDCLLIHWGVLTLVLALAQIISLLAWALASKKLPDTYIIAESLRRYVYMLYNAQ